MSNIIYEESVVLTHFLQAIHLISILFFFLYCLKWEKSCN